MYVFTTFTESGYRKLASFIRRARGSVAVPIPGSLCEDARRLGPDTLRKRGVPASFARVWRPVLGLLASTNTPRVECYLGEVDFEEARYRAVDVASLIIRADVYGVADLEEWVRVFRRDAQPVLELGEFTVVDDYVKAYATLKANPGAHYTALEEVVPTPFDLLALLALGELSRDLFGRLVEFSLRYFNDYLLRSVNLTRAYRRLVGDREYMDFLASHNIPVFK